MEGGRRRGEEERRAHGWDHASRTMPGAWQVQMSRSRSVKGEEKKGGRGEGSGGKRGGGVQRPDHPETPRITLTTAQCLPLSLCHKLEVLKSLVQHFLRNSQSYALKQVNLTANAYRELFCVRHCAQGQMELRRMRSLIGWCPYGQYPIDG